MRMVQVTVDQVVHMIAVGHGLVAAALAMLVAGIVPGARVPGRAFIRVRA